MAFFAEARHLRIIVLLSLLGCGLSAASSEAQLFPAPDSEPNLKYKSIRSVFHDPQELLTTNDLDGVFARLRKIASLTPEYHQELLSIIRKAAAVDERHAVLMIDGAYFPFSVYAQANEILGDEQACDRSFAGSDCQAKLTRVRENVARALEYGAFTNALVDEVLRKSGRITIGTARTLLDRLFPRDDSATSDDAFRVAVSDIGSIPQTGKLALFQLACSKNASDAAAELGASWIVGSATPAVAKEILSIVAQIPGHAAKDKFLVSASGTITRISADEAIAIIASSTEKDKVAEAYLQKVDPLSSASLGKIAASVDECAARDALILGALPLVRQTDLAGARRVVEQACQEKVKVADILVARFPNLSVSDLTSLVGNSAGRLARDQILLDNISKLSRISFDEAQSLVALAVNEKAAVAIALLPKVSSLDGISIAKIASEVGYGPDRDRVLDAGILQLTSFDLGGVGAMLKKSYATQARLAASLFPKVGSIPAAELARIAGGFPASDVRDAILFAGINIVSDNSVEATQLMLSEASSASKVKVGIAAFQRLPGLTALQMGSALMAVDDGPTRDSIMAGSLQFLDSITAEGAAKLVQLSFEDKASMALKLLSMVPGSTGTDLVKITSVCGSGAVRDRILKLAIPALGVITKEEARSIFALAYNNKEKVALQLLHKVDRLDGTTIADVASLSLNGTTRDVLITEGAKLLQSFDAAGLIAMIRAASLIKERIAMENGPKVTDLTADDGVAIAQEFDDLGLQDEILENAIDWIKTVDEPAITRLAVAANTRAAKEVIIKKGLAKLGDQ